MGSTTFPSTNKNTGSMSIVGGQCRKKKKKKKKKKKEKKVMSKQVAVSKLNLLLMSTLISLRTAIETVAVF